MRTLKLTLAYDGTQFAGWQRQKKARTVQQTLEEALQKITGSTITVIGAGRTDTGVHAEGQVAHIRLPYSHSRESGNQILAGACPRPRSRARMTLSPAKLLRALNANLPDDIVIRSIRIAPATFHAQYDAAAKRYRYTIWNNPIRPVLHRERMLHMPTPLNLAAMRQAARHLKGRHDFRAFYTDSRSVEETRRTLRSLTIASEGSTIQITAEADGFFYHMVRRIAGLLIDIGKGKHRPEVIRDILKGRGSVIAHTAPAKGLCLLQVRY